MRNQTRRQLAKYFDQFPALAGLRTQHKWEYNKVPQLPYTEVYVQRPDSEVMNMKGGHIKLNGRSYATGFGHNLRGTRVVKLFAIDFNEQVVAELNWYGGREHADQVFQDIFSLVDSQSVNYLVFATFEMWYHPSTEQQEMNDIYFGKLASATLRLIVYPKLKDKSWNDLTQEADTLKEEQENGYLRNPKEMPALPATHKAMGEGGLIHAFLSGGGLRVVSLKANETEEIGYGEHPYIEGALNLLEDDIIHGHREYGDVYGVEQPHYLTGSSFSSSNIDYWVRQGNTFDCWVKDNKVFCRLNGWSHYHAPDWAKEQSQQNPDTSIEWEDRGFRFSIVYQAQLFADSSPGWSINLLGVEDKEERLRAFDYHIQKLGQGANLWEALLASLTAPEEEVLPRPLL